MTPPDANVSAGRSISIIWLIPLVAVLVGGWMVYQHWQNQGPLVTLTFQTADGIEAGKTALRARNVKVGRVESVALNRNLDGVLVKARIDPAAAHLLREDTLFWVVRPRVDTAGITGLETLVSGAYIELRPGDGDKTRLKYTGLEQPPVTPPGTPGIRLTIFSKTGNSLSVGDSVTYHGHNVGRIEQATFDAAQGVIHYDLFVRAPFDELVSTGSRFWNVSGIDITTSTEGVKIRTGSLDTLLTGGIAFDVPEDWPEGEPAKDGDSYRLYANEAAITEQHFRLYSEYLLQFEQSIRGLKPGAPVEFRGIRIGTVVGLSERHMAMMNDYSGQIPVLIRLEPGRLGQFDAASIQNQLTRWIREGMRASLKLGNLLTGALYVDMDIYPDADKAQLTETDGIQVIPTVSGGLERIEQRVVAVLDKIQALPIEPVLVNADQTLIDAQATLKALETTLQSVNRLAASEDVQNVAPEIVSTLTELRETAQGMSPDSPLYHELKNAVQSLRDVLNKLEPVLDTLNDKPSALIFDKSAQPDLQPGAGQ